MDADAAVPGYREVAPPFALAPYVSCVWTNTIGPGDPDVVLPDGCADLLWVDGPGGGRVVVAGPDTGPRHVPVDRTTTFAGVRFRPGAASALLGVPLDAVADASVPLDDLWGRSSARRLTDRAAGTDAAAAGGSGDGSGAGAGLSGPGARPGLVLTRAVADRLARLDGDGAAGAVRGAALARALRAEDGPGAVARVAAGLGLSERQLHRRSRTLFGYGPKTLQRVLRFQDALRRARTHGGLARAAAEAGYADQAHFAREVRALAGTTAGELLA